MKSPAKGARLSRARGDAGFTLIEVLVALAIAALGLSALMAAAGQGMRNVTVANTYLEATRRAQTRLDIVGVIAPPVAGERFGDDGGGFTWRVRLSPVGDRAPPKGSDKEPLTLYDVTVTIGWKSGAASKSVTLQSQRLGRLGRS